MSGMGLVYFTLVLFVPNMHGLVISAQQCVVYFERPTQIGDLPVRYFILSLPHCLKSGSQVYYFIRGNNVILGYRVVLYPFLFFGFLLNHHM